MLVVAGAVLHDGVFRGDGRDVLIIGNLVERQAITAAWVHHGAVGHDQSLVEEVIQEIPVLLHPVAFFGSHGREKIRARRNIFTQIEFHFSLLCEIGHACGERRGSRRSPGPFLSDRPCYPRTTRSIATAVASPPPMQRAATPRLRFLGFERMQQRDDQPRAGGANGMTECAGATIDVKLLVGDAEILLRRHRHYGKGLVDLEQM